MMNRVRGVAITLLVLTAIILAACSGPVEPTFYGTNGATGYCCGGAAPDTTSTPVVSSQPLDTLAINLTTAKDWDGVHSIGTFGDSASGYITTMGQSFTTTAKDTLLNSFTFTLLSGGFAATNVRFTAYVAKWDGSKVVGSTLWQSALKSGIGKYTFNTSNLRLSPNAQYIVFLSTIGSPSGQLAQLGYCGSNADPLHPVSSNPYLGGRFFYLLADHTSAFTSPWSVDGGGDFDAAVIINLSNVAR